MVEIQEAYKLSLEDNYLAFAYLGNGVGLIGIKRTIPTVPVRVNSTFKLYSSHHTLIKAVVLFTHNFPG